MEAVYQIRVYENQLLIHTFECKGVVELGRQGQEDGPFAQKVEADHCRLVIAHRDEPNISRKHALIEPIGEDRFRVTNLSTSRPLHLADGRELRCRTTRELTAPIIFMLGGKTLRVQPALALAGHLHSLPELTRPPGSSVVPASLVVLSQSMAEPNQAQRIVRWLRSVMDVLQSAASSSDFFERAAQAVVQLVGLDSGRVLLLKQGEWQTQATQNRPSLAVESDWKPSRHVLNSVCREKGTFWELPAASEPAVSLMGIQAVVAAPILDGNGTVIGVLYGERRRGNGFPGAKPITELEALLVELLASGVAAGLARLEQEQAALAARVRFEQFFTPELSRYLEARPDLLEGRDTEVTLLFCDIRGFSRISERIGPKRTIAWVGAVMGTLSDCVRTHAGVLVDYIGDELIAMWGAPEAQPDHAQLACRSALEMLGALPELNRQWQQVLGEPMDLGIGINTGIAQVGNIGTQHKFKYGPLGSSVNLASRVQGATKHLKTRLLITGATHSRLGAEFDARRLCRVRVVNIQEPVDLYELPPPGHPCWPEAKQEYEMGLAEFEKRNFRQAALIAANLLAKCPDDGPALLLGYRALSYRVHEPAPTDLVWELPGK